MNDNVQRIVLTDTSVLINFLHVGLLSLLGALAGFDFVLPVEVRREVRHPEQAEALEEAIQRGSLKQIEITEPAEMDLLAKFTEVMGLGEAACLAVAESRGWLLASDERGRFARIAAKRLGQGRMVNTPGLLLLAIQQGHLTVAEADRVKAKLEKHRFKMKFGSFGDLV